MFKLNQIDETHLQFSGFYDAHVKYDFESYKSAVENFKENSIGTMKGFDYPVNTSDASHVIENINMDDNGMVYGTLKILNTPNGNTLKDICNMGQLQYLNVVPVGTSHTNDDGTVTNIEIKTFNINFG